MGLGKLRRRVKRWWTQPAIGGVDLGDLARAEPISRQFGWDRGLPVDRRYIEAFLGKHAADIRGEVLEVADPRYTKQLGGERVTRSEVIHPVPGNARATRVANIETGEGLPPEAYDCAIVAQTLQYVFDLPAAASHLARCLKPGGVLLVTVPGITQVSTTDRDQWGEHWRFTSASLRRVLSTAFASVEVEAFGNVYASVAFLEGLAVEDVDPALLDVHDPGYEMLVAARATRGG